MAQYIYGRNTAREKLNSKENIQEAYVLEGFKDESILSLLRKRKIDVITCSRSKLDKMANNTFHQGIILKVKEYDTVPLSKIIDDTKDNDRALVVILDGIEDPHNMGAILRTCEAIGANGVVIPKIDSAPLNATTAKTSTGAIELVPIAKVANLVNAINELKENGYWIVGAEAFEAQDYREVDYNSKIAIVMGSEGFGISKLVLKNCDFRVKMPMVGKINSLNVSVATAVLLYQIYNSRNPLK